MTHAPMLVPVAGGSIAVNCRHFRGDRPCALGHQGLCAPGCGDFAALGTRVLIIKLAALGDVIRTTAILPGLRDMLGVCHVTWVTRGDGARMLAGNPLIDRLLVLDAETLAHLEHEQFDLCICLDKEPAPAGLAMRVHARDRRGIGLSEYGTPIPLNAECEPYFRLGLDDDLKFRGNAHSYAELIYSAIGLRYSGQRYSLHPSPKAQHAARRMLERAGVDENRPLLGLNTGAGSVFANKTWPPEKFLQLARVLRAREDVRVVLLGGARERELNRELAAHADVIDLGCDHDEQTFAALVGHCAALVTGDTMALHVAVALEVPVIALFGPTCPQEIDLFGRGEKIISPLACAPCYRRQCDITPHCMDTIGLERVVAAIERWLPGGQRKANPGDRAAAARAAIRRLSLPVVEASA